MTFNRTFIYACSLIFTLHNSFGISTSERVLWAVNGVTLGAVSTLIYKIKHLKNMGLSPAQYHEAQQSPTTQTQKNKEKKKDDTLKIALAATEEIKTNHQRLCEQQANLARQQTQTQAELENLQQNQVTQIQTLTSRVEKIETRYAQLLKRFEGMLTQEEAADVKQKVTQWAQRMLDLESSAKDPLAVYLQKTNINQMSEQSLHSLAAASTGVRVIAVGEIERRKENPQKQPAHDKLH